MMQEPQESDPPLQVFPAVTEWLASGTVHAEPAIPDAAEPASDVLPMDGIRERALTIDTSTGRLFAIVTEPAGTDRSELCAVLLNAGPQRHTGPNRMWVETARRWAAR